MPDLKLADGPAGDQKLCKMPMAVLEAKIDRWIAGGGK